MKKGLLRALSAVVAISMLFCMSMVAFADVTTSTSVTEYDFAKQEVTVETKVEGAELGEQVAFLVEQGTEIIWIDQKPATDGTATSSFTTTVAKAVGAKATVGTASTAATDITQAGTIALPNYTVEWEVVGSNKASVVAVVKGAEITQEGTTSDQVTFYFAAPANEKLASVTYGSVVDNNPQIIGGAVSYTITANTEFTFTFVAKTVADDDPEDETDNTVVSAVVGDSHVYNPETKKASVVATAANATEFGIVVAKADYDFADISDIFSTLDDEGGEGAKAVKLHALGADAQGRFAIVISDENRDFFVEGIDYVAKVYAVRNDGSAPVFSDTTFALN